MVFSHVFHKLNLLKGGVIATCEHETQQWMLLISKKFHLTIYITARVYVNGADEFHILRRRAVRRVYTIFPRSKKCATHVPLLFSARSFLCSALLSETKNFLVWKSGEWTTENLRNEKSYQSINQSIYLTWPERLAKS